MRKDIFIVGARLLGIWQLLGAIRSFAYIASAWLGYIRPQSYTQEYNVLLFIVELVTGLYLIFRTHNLFHLVDRLKPEEDTVEQGETDIDDNINSTKE
jgi:hypothetical protein